MQKVSQDTLVDYDACVCRTYKSNGQYSLVNDVRTYRTGVNSITYSNGRRLPSGHWPWKECVHDEALRVVQPFFGYAELESETIYGGQWKTYKKGVMHAPWVPSSLPAVPSVAWDRSTLGLIMDQLDLNTSDSVLLYSGVLQAVPLLGGVLKFNSIMRSVQRHITKSLRRKPFTTVIRDLIQADFVDRFVISPMLDDLRKFQDATDYTIRVIQTARERNAHIFALSAESSQTLSSKTGTARYGQGVMCTFYGDTTTSTDTTSKAFALLEAKYDVGAIDPLKVWAQRVGLTRPLDSVWDLVPFSFVVDYFTRAGDFISHLSDEMSSVQGLKGRIVRIHDLWGTIYNRSVGTCRGTRYSGMNSGGLRVKTLIQRLLTAQTVSSHFARFRVPNPYHSLMSAERREDYLSINLDLSTTRKRTLAELVIQAKL